MPAELFAIEIVHIQCSKLLKRLECAMLYIVLCTMKNPCHSTRNGQTPIRTFHDGYFHDSVEMDVKQYSLTHSKNVTVLSYYLQTFYR